MKNVSGLRGMYWCFLSTALIGTAFCFYPGITFAADDWVRSFGKPGTALLSMTEFDGDLYVLSSGEKYQYDSWLCPGLPNCPPPPQ